MSKPISFGFGKPKSSSSAQASSTPSRKPAASKGPSRTALHHESDNEDEEEPRHESVTGFSASGAILSQPAQEPFELVIKNAGNSDWRRRGRKNLLPTEVQAQQNGGDVVIVERDEVSNTSGLQLADKMDPERYVNAGRQGTPQPHRIEPPPKELTADEEALHALLDDGSGKPKSNAIISQRGNIQLSSRDEVEDFKDDVAARPDPSTLEEYAAMPVEEFGLAMLRGMGQKRRANGEVINLSAKPEDNSRKLRKQEGFLGIGAKPAPGTDIELGAWGRADMRKNAKGQGFFTPLMRENKTTGERISEEEFQKRIVESKGAKEKEDWRKRRDRNLENSGRDLERDRDSPRSAGDDYRDQMNSFSRSSSSKRERDDRESSRSKRDKDDYDYESSRSRREDERSKDRKRDDYDGRHQDKHRDRYRNGDSYDSGSSHRRNRERDRERDRDGDQRQRDKR
ncbi:hypothetical protein A1O3_08766 [Capronia epimyces CBS 606.96]|uniref:Pre-mRNA-splicing factor n=1 Tax=Capronia epimyces CBS 606.96 TaxID=1182542 RepID=W9XPK0_9EURO|nr:uncharacterized protein A1O3_08766 [Capronia epimyces CBS 606.96]EXJ79265.1 hypothetical protein A1O3_08766 [Capronia epimyces CBS 606.96]